MIENEAYENRYNLIDNERVIHAIKNSTFTKYNKYRVELELCGEKSKIYWLTEKQMRQLEWLFDMTPNGYSCKKIAIIGVFSDEGYYCYAKYCRAKNVFHEPYQHDLEELKDA